MTSPVANTTCLPFYLTSFVYVSVFVDYLQKVKASKAEGGEQSSSRLLEQLGLYPSATSEELSNTSEKKEEPRSEEKQRQEKEEEESGDVFLPVERPIQKNKKRCWTCKTKLELAQRELGGCKCGESHSK